MELLYEKLNSLFKVDTNHVVLVAYRHFKMYTRPQDMTIANFNIKFDCKVQQFGGYEINLPDAALALQSPEEHQSWRR